MNRLSSSILGPRFPILLLVLAAGCGPKPSKFSGLWHFSETDPECRHTYSSCWLRLEQEGDRVTVKAWGEGDDWTCEGRGAVAGGALTFRWYGPRKGWRGTATLERQGDELRGTYVRDVEGAAVQHCRGVRR